MKIWRPVIKHIFTSIVLLIDKIAVFDVISEKQMHPQCVTNADFGQEASSDHIFLRTRLIKQQLLMVLDIATR